MHATCTKSDAYIETSLTMLLLVNICIQCTLTRSDRGENVLHPRRPKKAIFLDSERFKYAKHVHIHKTKFHLNI